MAFLCQTCPGQLQKSLYSATQISFHNVKPVQASTCVSKRIFLLDKHDLLVPFERFVRIRNASPGLAGDTWNAPRSRTSSHIPLWRRQLKEHTHVSVSTIRFVTSHASCVPDQTRRYHEQNSSWKKSSKRKMRFRRETQRLILHPNGYVEHLDQSHVRLQYFATRQ